MDCAHLSDDLKDLANDTVVEENAPGAKVNRKQVRTDTEDRAPLHKKVKTVQNTLVGVAVTTGKAKYQHAMDLRQEKGDDLINPVWDREAVLNL